MGCEAGEGGSEVAYKYKLSKIKEGKKMETRICRDWSKRKVQVFNSQSD